MLPHAPLCFIQSYVCPFKFPFPLTIRSISSVVISSINALLYPSSSGYFSWLTGRCNWLGSSSDEVDEVDEVSEFLSSSPSVFPTDEVDEVDEVFFKSLL